MRLTDEAKEILYNDELGADSNARYYIYYSAPSTLKFLVPKLSGVLHNPTDKRISIPVYSPDGKTTSSPESAKLLAEVKRLNPKTTITKMMVGSWTGSTAKPATTSTTTKPVATTTVTKPATTSTTTTIPTAPTTTTVTKPATTSTNTAVNAEIPQGEASGDDQNKKMILAGVAVACVVVGVYMLKPGKKKKRR